MTLRAAADGSALGNPGPAGWAWYIDDARWRAGGWPHGTNNMGELQAVRDLLEATAGRAGEELEILCDSRYVIDSVTKWMPGWKRRGWRKADGKPVLNRELLEGIDTALRGRTVRFTWVKGHAGHELNEAADARARACAMAYRDGLPIPHGPGLGDGAIPAATKAAAAAPATPLAAAPGPAAAQEDPRVVVAGLEAAFLAVLRRGTGRGLDALLHPDFRLADGREGRDARALAAALTPVDLDAGEPTVTPVGERAMQVTYVTRGGDDTVAGPVARTSLWWLGTSGWRLRLHQVAR